MISLALRWIVDYVINTAGIILLGIIVWWGSAWVADMLGLFYDNFLVCVLSLLPISLVLGAMRPFRRTI